MSDIYSNKSKSVSPSASLKYLMDHPIKQSYALAPMDLFPFRGPQTTSQIEDYRDGKFRENYVACKISIKNDEEVSYAGYFPRRHACLISWIDRYLNVHRPVCGRLRVQRRQQLSPMAVLGDMNQDGSLSAPCNVGQNERGGLFFVVEEQPLAESLRSLLSGGTN